MSNKRSAAEQTRAFNIAEIAWESWQWPDERNHRQASQRLSDYLPKDSSEELRALAKRYLRILSANSISQSVNTRLGKAAPSDRACLFAEELATKLMTPDAIPSEARDTMRTLIEEKMLADPTIREPDDWISLLPPEVLHAYAQLCLDDQMNDNDAKLEAEMQRSKSELSKLNPQVTLTTDGSSIWSESKEPVPVKVLGMRLNYISDEWENGHPAYGELLVEIDPATWDSTSRGLIYTDSGFLRSLRSYFEGVGIIADDVDFSEFDMQRKQAVSCDVGNAFLGAAQRLLGLDWTEVRERRGNELLDRIHAKVQLKDDLSTKSNSSNDEGPGL